MRPDSYWSITVLEPVTRDAMHHALLLLVDSVDGPFRFHTSACHDGLGHNDYLILQASPV